LRRVNGEVDHCGRCVARRPTKHVAASDYKTCLPRRKSKNTRRLDERRKPNIVRSRWFWHTDCPPDGLGEELLVQTLATRVLWHVSTATGHSSRHADVNAIDRSFHAMSVEHWG
jgi:hypothetical protein